MLRCSASAENLPGKTSSYTPGTKLGTAIGTLGFNFSILGMLGNSYLYTMDGVNNNDNSLNTGVIGAL